MFRAISPSPSSRLRRRGVRVAVTVGASAAALVATSALAGAGPANAGAPGASRADIPWRQVGHGWTLATWSPRPGARKSTLFLVAPSGDQRYRIGGFGRYAEPLAWSPNKRLAFVSNDPGVFRINLVTGKRTKIHGNGEVLTFTPNSRAFIKTVDIPHGQYVTPRLERFAVSGKKQVEYPVKVAGAGTLDTYRVLVTGDGKLVTGAAHGLVLLGHDGSVVRRLAGSHGRCFVGGRWGSGVVQASCRNGALWAVPLSGADPTKLTDGRSQEDPFGYSKIWRYSQGRLGLAPNGCGPESVVRFDAGGHGRRVDVPSPNRMRGSRAYVGHHGDVVTMTIETRPGCEPHRIALFAWDAVYGTTHVLLGPGANGGTVRGALAYPKDQ